MALLKSSFSLFPFQSFLLFCLIISWQCRTENKIVVDSIGQGVQDNNIPVSIRDKQRGAHVFGRIDSNNVKPLLEANFEWITLVPYAGQKEYNSAELRSHRGDSIQIINENEYWLERIEIAREEGFKVFVKPHIWVHNETDGKWRSDIFPTDEVNWKIWKEDYRKFIFRYARIAEKANAEMFCIGTELSRLSVEKPAFWKSLIKEVRNIYSGKITYAANWYNEYEKIEFWNELDFIGIQAYFPLSKKENPSIEEISKGWKKYIPALEKINAKFARPILFTEVGYKSTKDCAIKPWEWAEHTTESNETFSLETQANCYQAFFETVWTKDWFAGIHLWQWRCDYQKDQGEMNLDFTPQFKPALKVIANSFELNE